MLLEEPSPLSHPTMSLLIMFQQSQVTNSSTSFGNWRKAPHPSRVTLTKNALLWSESITLADSLYHYLGSHEPRPLAHFLRRHLGILSTKPCRTNSCKWPAKASARCPMHTVHKEHSTTTKLRVVFDASAKSMSGVSLNDTLLVGPTVHPPLLDVLLRFRSHRVAVTADVSKMYRAIELTTEDRDFHRFV